MIASGSGTARWLAAVAGSLIIAAALTQTAAAGTTRTTAAQPLRSRGTAPSTPIEHFVFLMQGDRTFDSYFSTYPGANGAPPGTCQLLVLAKPRNGCVKPFPLHGRAVDALAAGKTVLDYQYDGGKLDGFVAAYLRQGRDGTAAMGYYDRHELPLYWALAERYVLFDNFFASARYGNRTNRSFWVSAAPQPGGTDSVNPKGYGDQATIFDRLQAAGVSWKFYVEGYNPHQTFRSVSSANPAAQTVRVPLLNYARFVDNPTLSSHIVDLSEYYQDLAAGRLPAVAYISSSGSSERSSRSMPAGQALVQRLVTQLMLSTAWSHSAFMWSYDGSGGWFDHVKPPVVGGNVLGLRVPALLISPYAPAGEVNHAQLDYTGALRFIEDNWGVASLTERDRHATSIAEALRLTTPPRPASLIQSAPPPPGPVVKIGIAYWTYLGALFVALMLFLGASAGPRLVHLVRRLTRRRRDDGERPRQGHSEPLAGVLVPKDW
jgi:phospholipase C